LNFAGREHLGGRYRGSGILRESAI